MQIITITLTVIDFLNDAIKEHQSQKRKFPVTQECSDEFNDDSKTSRQIKRPFTYKDFLQTIKPSFYSTIERRIDSLLRWIVTSQQPFSIVEENSFVKFVSNLDPYYKIPHCKALSTRIRNQFDLTRIKVKDILISNPTTFSRAYSPLEMRTFLLDIISLPDAYTVGIKERLIGFTSNSIKNHLTCLDFFQKHIKSNPEYIYCAVHIIELIVKACLEEYLHQIQKVRYNKFTFGFGGNEKNFHHFRTSIPSSSN
ncbi:zinc finger bed domain-containing protein ricesleeper 2-like [Gigaspora margarita]|uniref:Zinc finger bed domain-containing protein ricesleeper 2-like n=1 Tax=Gigaspora margarita TaxID=4874 RepID=A0A8H4EJD4_GIGMA|nr:zinc finger bed domain-containing protein ricesleeper 2-like [Gigaspora margarita]